MYKLFPVLLTIACLSIAGSANAQQRFPNNTNNDIGGSANPVNNQIGGSMDVYPPPENIKVKHPGINTPNHNIVVKPSSEKADVKKKPVENGDDSDSNN